MFAETRARSIFKALSWRILASITTALVVFIFTRQVGLAAAVGGLEAVVKFALYFVHERVWDKVMLGRRPATTLASAGRADLDINVKCDEPVSRSVPA